MIESIVRTNKNAYIIYPENQYKGMWDVLITIVLLVSCIMTPLDIAFQDEENSSTSSIVFNAIIDVLFAVDVVVIFNTAYYNQDVDLIDSRKTISINYLKGWFTVDMLAIIPFDAIMNATDYG